MRKTEHLSQRPRGLRQRHFTPSAARRRSKTRQDNERASQQAGNKPIAQPQERDLALQPSQQKKSAFANTQHTALGRTKISSCPVSRAASSRGLARYAVGQSVLRLSPPPLTEVQEAGWCWGGGRGPTQNKPSSPGPETERAGSVAGALEHEFKKPHGWKAAGTLWEALPVPPKPLSGRASHPPAPCSATHIMANTGTAALRLQVGSNQR